MSDKTTPSESWTDEKHSQFLNSMEASFVRTMFESKAPSLRLDRQLPDTSDSTLDSKIRSTHRSNSLNDAISDYNFGPTRRMDGGSGKRSGKRTSQPLNSSQDQVVPQLANRHVGKDEREHQNVP